MNDLRWGKGLFGFSNGDIFIGSFIKDMAEGEGRRYFWALILGYYHYYNNSYFKGSYKHN